MKRLIRLLLGCAAAAAIGFACLPLEALAAVQAQTVKVTTVIDNIADCPPEVQNGTFVYQATRVYSLNRGRTVGGRWQATKILIPSKDQSVAFNVRNGGTQNLYFRGLNDSANVNLLTLQASANVDSHLSFSYMEYGAGARSYTYTDNGQANPTIIPFNWADLTSSTANLTLHFRYNPDIDKVPDEEVPAPAYTKKIDYLGDGVTNPDTNASGPNDYRVYLSVDTAPPAEEERDKDVVFLLDVSGSMSYSFGGSGSRLESMKVTVNKALDTLVKNPKTMISIISFSGNSTVLIRRSNDIRALKAAVQGLKANGGTNYYQGFLSSAGLVNSVLSDKETTVFFVTDGEPTSAQPAVNTYGYDIESPVSLTYAAKAAETFPAVDHFFSIFIGGSTGNASTLQTVTQKIPSGEKYMIQANDATAFENAMSRFLAKMDKSLYNVVIEDTLSSYVDYLGSSKVVSVTDAGQAESLVGGKDYTLDYDAASNKLTFRLLKNTSEGTHYILSYNVRSSDEALRYYNDYSSYPHVGDADTDYTGNATSSGQPGFYAGTQATLHYSYGGGSTDSKTYPQPVVQVVPPQPVPLSLAVNKVLKGRELAAGQFSFALYKATPNGETLIETVQNQADGTVTFSGAQVSLPGTYTYYIREVIPASPALGYTYDNHTVTVTATVVREGDELKIASLSYGPDGGFVNEYKPLPVDVVLEATKLLQGRPLAAGEFTFALLDSNGRQLGEAKNTAGGAVKFDAIRLTQEGVYTYTIRESVPIPADSHITYDTGMATATVTVTDEGGRLRAAVAYTPDNVFENKFEFKPADATIRLQKILTGMQLTQDAFTFELKELKPDGKTLETTNFANGDVLFEVRFKEPGVYRFEAREKLPDVPDKYMNYDGKVISIEVTVSDDGSGDLQAVAAYSDTDSDATNDQVFYNTYQVRGGTW